MIEESQEQELTLPPSPTDAVKIVESYNIGKERAEEFVKASIFNGVVCEDTLYQLIDSYLLLIKEKTASTTTKNITE